MGEPLDDQASACLVKWLHAHQNGEAPAKPLPVPRDMNVFLSFIMGSRAEMVGDELWTEPTMTGTVLFWRWSGKRGEDYSALPEDLRPPQADPEYIGFFSLTESKVYLLDPEELDSRGLFGKLHTTLVARILSAAISKQTAPDMEMDAWAFHNLPAEERTALTFLGWCVMFNRERTYQLSEKTDDIWLEVALSKEFKPDDF